MKNCYPALLISVIGGNAPSAEDYEAAYRVGQGIAKRGAILICGGLKGVMEAACQGAKQQGGVTVGILPGNDPCTANQYVDIPITTGLGSARNSIVAKAGKAVIAIDGAYGTLSEIGFALSENIPVIGLNTWSLSVGDQIEVGIIIAKDPEDAVEKAMCLIQNNAS